MSLRSTKSFLDSMARPAEPCQQTFDRRKALQKVVLKSMTNMLEAINHHRTTESNTQTDAIEDVEPMELRKRLVFRANVRVSKRALVHLQKCYHRAEAFINKVLAGHDKLCKRETKIYGNEVFGCSEEDAILLRCALREQFEA